MDNLNTDQYLQRTKQAVIENIRRTGAPSVQLQHVPRQSLLHGDDDDLEGQEQDADEDEHPDERKTQLYKDNKITRDDEFEESDDEMNDEIMITENHAEKSKRIASYTNPLADEEPDIEPVMSGALGAPSRTSNDLQTSPAQRSGNKRLWAGTGAADLLHQDNMDIDDDVQDDEEEEEQAEKDDEDVDMVVDDIVPTIEPEGQGEPEDEDEDKGTD